jgi:hypothetical protein
MYEEEVNGYDKTKVVTTRRRTTVPPPRIQPITLARAFTERAAVIEPASDGTTLEVKKRPARRRRIA